MNSIIVLVVLGTIVGITLAAHIESEYMYFGNASTIIFWLTSSVGAIVTIITGFKATDALIERYKILR